MAVKCQCKSTSFCYADFFKFLNLNSLSHFKQNYSKTIFEYEFFGHYSKIIFECDYLAGAGDYSKIVMSPGRPYVTNLRLTLYISCVNT